MEELELPTENSKAALKEVIKSILNTEDYSFTITQGSNIGDNYIGVVYRIVATRNTENTTDDNQSVSIILKLPPQNLARREQFFARPCFLRETLVYDEILPLFKRFQESKGHILRENTFYEVPECYRTINDEFSEALFFEDLKVLGFEMFDRHKEVTLEHTVLVMRVLGKFHAISYALRDQDFPKLKSYMDIDDLFTLRKNNVVLKDYMNSQITLAKNTLKPGIDDHLMAKIDAIFANGAMDALLKCVDGKASEPYSVICHGDCWNNNVLFKCKDGVPTEIRLLDWQIVRYASPVCDIVYYIFCSTTKEFRDKHYDTLMKVYYDSMSSLLKSFGSAPNELFPYKAFDDQLQRFGHFGLIMATLVVPLFTCVQEDLPDFDEVSEQIERDKQLGVNMFKFESTQNLYAVKMRDIIVDMDRLGYI